MGAKEDLERYFKAMCSSGGGASVCLNIEKKYDLDGYPPEIVTGALQALIDGKDMGQVLDKMLEVEGGKVTWKVEKTDVLGVGPWVVYDRDEVICTTRKESDALLIAEAQNLRKFKASVRLLVEKAEYEIKNGYPITIATLLAGLKIALNDGPVTVYKKTFKGGCAGLEEVNKNVVLD